MSLMERSDRQAALLQDISDRIAEAMYRGTADAQRRAMRRRAHGGRGMHTSGDTWKRAVSSPSPRSSSISCPGEVQNFCRVMSPMQSPNSACAIAARLAKLAGDAGDAQRTGHSSPRWSPRDGASAAAPAGEVHSRLQPLAPPAAVVGACAARSLHDGSWRTAAVANGAAHAATLQAGAESHTLRRSVPAADDERCSSPLMHTSRPVTFQLKDCSASSTDDPSSEHPGDDQRTEDVVVGSRGLDIVAKTACAEATTEGPSQRRSSRFIDRDREMQTRWWRWRKRAWQFMEDRQSSRGAHIFNIVSTSSIFICAWLAMVDVFFPKQFFAPSIILVLEAPFAVELMVRFTVCPNRHVFFFDVCNIIDLLAVLLSALPRALSIAFLDEETAYNCEVFSPLLVMLRLLRRFDYLQLLTSAFAAAAQALPVLLYTLLLIALFHAAAIYLAEPRHVIPSMRDSVWFTMVTMSTVGYGDISPVTEIGRALSVLLMIISSLYMAIPIGIVGNAFSSVWADRDRLLVLQHMRRRITRAGCTAMDLVEMFNELDEDGNAQLSFEEFKEFLPMMHINMSDEVALRVFNSFDDDGDGINFQDFLMGVFPALRYFRMATMSTRDS